MLAHLTPSRSLLNTRFGYRREVVDLGDEGGDRVRGIFSPCYEDTTVRKYIQAQFLDHAATYAKKYDAVDLFKSYLQTAFQTIGLGPEKRRGLTILDIGSGSGNTIFPLLELCPNSSVIGSDLSLEMMILLKQALLRQGRDANCYLLQLNAEELDFRPATFDLIVGGAILHHLFHPDRAIAGCAAILKKGGHAIFFEPFAEGFIELRDCYAEILADPRSTGLSDQVRNFFQAMITDINVRLGTDKSAPLYQQLDDKWLFPKAYFQDLARRSGFSDCLIYSLHPHDAKLERETVTLMRLAIQQPPEAAPEWVWHIIKAHDDKVPKERKPEVLLEACVVFKR
jgi:ubiquinone/menaquinone biosynthesis C-methylase UbiE